MATPHIDTEVLIVGAGPSGLALAIALREAGITPMLIEREPRATTTSRACVVHARTLEVLEPFGVTRELLRRGVRVPIFRVRDRDRPLITIDFSEIDSAYPFTLMCPQDRVEQCLRDRLTSAGGNIHQPAELTGFSVKRDRIECAVRVDGTVRDISARWLVGCDGMHSRVRELSAIPFEGGTYSQSFVLADVRMDWPLSREEVTLFYAPKGLVVVAPLPDDHHRIVAATDAAPEHPLAEFMQILLDERGPLQQPGRIRDVVWSSRFHLHHRVTNTGRKGRILLCGDAAHVHSPAGGQGMNTGLQDSISLAPALAAALTGGDEHSLDIWARDRHAIAVEVVTMTDRLTRLATLKSRTGQSLRNLAVAFAGHLPLVRTAIANRLAELNTRDLHHAG